MESKTSVMHTFIARNKSDILKALLVSLVVPWSFCCASLQIYLGNSHDFLLLLNDLWLSFSLVILGAGTLLFLIQLPFIGRKYFAIVNIILFLPAFFIWCQENIFNRIYTMEDYDGYIAVFLSWSTWESVLYYLLIAAAVLSYKTLTKHISRLSLLLILAQLIPLCVMIGSRHPSLRTSKIQEDFDIPHHPDKASWRQYQYTYSGFFDFSRTQNVIIFVLDSQGFHAFEKILEREPELRESLRDFISFSHALSDTRFTLTGIMQILTGCEIPEKLRVPYEDIGFYEHFQKQAYTGEGALIKSLAESGFRCDIIPCGAEPIYWDSRWISNIRLLATKVRTNYLVEIRTLFSWTLFRIAPSLLKERVSSLLDIYNLAGRFEAPNRQSVQGEEYLTLFPMAYEPPEFEFKHAMENRPWYNGLEQSCFKFVHFNGPHPAFFLNEHGERENHADLDSERRQNTGCLRIFVDFLNRLKEIGAYDNSLIVLTADHGSFPLSTDAIIDNSRLFHPILLIKRQNAHQERMVYNDLPVRTRDIAPTVFQELGHSIKPDEISVFSMPDKIAEQRNADWNQRRNRYDKRYFSSSFQKQETPPRREEGVLELQRFHVSIRDREVRFELFGDSRDKIGRQQDTTISLVLDPVPEKNFCYLSQPIEPLRPGKSWQHQFEFLFGDWGTNFWGAVVNGDVGKVEDGDYRVGVQASFTDENYRSLDYLLKIRKGVPVELVPVESSANGNP